MDSEERIAYIHQRIANICEDMNDPELADPAFVQRRLKLILNWIDEKGTIQQFRRSNDFQRGAKAMRDSVESLLRSHSAAFRKNAEDESQIVVKGGYKIGERLLLGYANGIAAMELPDEPSAP